MPPLQSHDQYDEIWQPPPPERFCSYTPSDEKWARPLGIGKIVRRPLPLYDVRHMDCSLVGYISQNPNDWRDDMVVSVLQDPFIRSRRDNFGAIAPYTPSAVKTIRILISTMLLNRQTFACWMVRSYTDAADLVRAGVIKHFGEDNINKYCHSLMVKQWEMEQRLMRDFPHIRQELLS